MQTEMGSISWIRRFVELQMKKGRNRGGGKAADAMRTVHVQVHTFGNARALGTPEPGERGSKSSRKRLSVVSYTIWFSIFFNLRKMKKNVT